MDKEELKYLLALSYIQGIGSIRIKLLIDHLKSPAAIWSTSDKLIKEILGPKIGESFVNQRRALNPTDLHNRIKRDKVKVLTLWDEEYPRLLKEIPDPPPLLYLWGEITLEDEKSLAIVGTRQMTRYGREVTELFAREISQAGFTIISGLARGIDSCAHKAALEAAGRTIAVLGSGLGNIYPAENSKLASQIAKNGAVVSELPPEVRATPGNFPARNRIISGLSLGVIITEAAGDSGSLITAGCALEQNREVFAVPGPIFSKQSEGTSRIIKEGAKLITRVEDVLEELGVQPMVGVQPLIYKPKNETEEKLLSLLEEQKHIDELVRDSQLDSGEVGSTLSLLELGGVVKNLGSGCYKRV